MLRPFTTLLLAWQLSAAMPAHADGLADFTATYKVTRGALTVGSSRLALTREPDGGYHYESHSRPSPWAAWFTRQTQYETSRGRMDTQGIRPDTYHYLRTGGDSDRVAHLTFDWEDGIVVNNVAGSRWTMDIPAGTQDKLSTQLAMMQALAGGGTDLSFRVADGGTLKDYRFRVSGEERVEVPAGEFDTVRVERLHDNGGRETVAWCAAGLGYLPVRIWQREQDDTGYMSELEGFSRSP